MYIFQIVGVWLFFLRIPFVCGGRGTFGRTNDDTFQMLIAGGIIPKHGKYVNNLVSIRTRNYIEFHGDNHLCTGIVISSRTILTAAHCVTNRHKSAMLPRVLLIVFDTKYRLGHYERDDTRLVDRIVVHHKFERYTNYDVALLQLTRRIPVNVKPYRIRHKRYPGQQLREGDQCVTMGWGQVYEHGPYANEIMYLEVTVRSPAFCTDLKYFVSENICAEPHGEGEVCAGDVGGPLICKDNLEGIIGGSKGCRGDKKLQFMNFTRVEPWVWKEALKMSANRCKLSLLLAIVSLTHLIV